MFGLGLPQKGQHDMCEWLTKSTENIQLSDRSAAFCKILQMRATSNPEADPAMGVYEASQGLQSARKGRARGISPERRGFCEYACILTARENVAN